MKASLMMINTIHTLYEKDDTGYSIYEFFKESCPDTRDDIEAAVVYIFGEVGREEILDL